MSMESWTVFRLPRSHWHCTFANFQWEQTKPASLRGAIADFVAALSRGEAPHLLLTGAPGIGKSHLGVALYRAGVALYGTGLTYWCNVPALCEKVKRAYGKEEDFWPEIEEARRLIVLDDLFGRELTQHEVNAVVYRMIDTAYTNGAAVVVTMNQSHEELQARLHAHEVSRLLANHTILPLVASKDWRR